MCKLPSSSEWNFIYLVKLALGLTRPLGKGNEIFLRKKSPVKNRQWEIFWHHPPPKKKKKHLNPRQDPWNDRESESSPWKILGPGYNAAISASAGSHKLELAIRLFQEMHLGKLETKKMETVVVCKVFFFEYLSSLDEGNPPNNGQNDLQLGSSSCGEDVPKLVLFQDLGGSTMTYWNFECAWIN